MCNDTPFRWRWLIVMVLSGIVGAGLCGLGLLFIGAGHGPGWAGIVFVTGSIVLTVSVGGIAVLFGYTCLRTMFQRHRHWRIRVSCGLLFSVGCVFGVMLLRNAVLSWAVWNGHSSICRMLIAVGANQRDDNLYVAARMGHIETVRVLVEGGANVNARLRGNGNSVLFAAIENISRRKDDNVEVIVYLLEHGADPCETLQGQTLPELAKKKGRSHAVVMILERYRSACENK